MGGRLSLGMAAAAALVVVLAATWVPGPERPSAAAVGSRSLRVDSARSPAAEGLRVATEESHPVESSEVVSRAAAGAPPALLAVPRRAPVLLVPGWFNDGEEMEPMRERFLAEGWDSAAVVALDFENPVGSNRAHARELARAVLALKERTGARRVDVVAHSMGGLALRYYLWNGGAADVRRAVFLATPHRGTMSAFLAWGEGAEEMRPGSAFLVSITRAPVLPADVSALTVRTPLDLHVLPPESAILPGVPDVEVCCPTHEGMLDDDETFEAVRRFLDGG